VAFQQLDAPGLGQATSSDCVCWIGHLYSAFKVGNAGYSIAMLPSPYAWYVVRPALGLPSPRRPLRSFPATERDFEVVAVQFDGPCVNGAIASSLQRVDCGQRRRCQWWAATDHPTAYAGCH